MGDIARTGRMDGNMHLYPVRVYFEDTDAGGIVYHANYLKYMERARTEMLRCLDFSHEKLMAENETMFVARRCELEYRAPARLDDALTVKTTLCEFGKVRLHLDQDIYLGDQLITIGKIELVSTDLAGKPKRLPKTFMDVIS